MATTTAKADQILVAPTLIQTGYGERAGQAPRVPGLEKPLGTAVAGGIKHAVVAAHLQRQFGHSVGHGADEPCGTVTAGGGGKSALVAAFLAQHNAGPHNHGLAGRDAREPVSTLMASGSQQSVVSAGLLSLKGADRRLRSVEDPANTVCAGGTHAAEVRAFLIKYYGTAVGQVADDPLHAATAKARFGLVTVNIDGEPWVIADIGMRMLTPRELFRAQGFPDRYVINPIVNGKPLTKTAQIRLAGNSVCPDVAAALVRANLAEASEDEREAAA